MGCDIHIVTEIRQNGKWRGVDEIPESFDSRNYSLFGVLAGVRDYFNVMAFEPKGLPDDLSQKKFYFKSERANYERIYNEKTTKMFISETGEIMKTSAADCQVEITEEEYNRIHELDFSSEEYQSRYAYLGYSQSMGVKTYHVDDAYSKNGVFKEVPYTDIYATFEDYLHDVWEEDFDEDAQDYGRWDVDFNLYCDYGDYHSASYLTLTELLNGDYTKYASNHYKMDGHYYEAFVANGGVFPENFVVEGATKPADIADCFREAMCPTVMISWPKSEEERKKLTLFVGIEELKAIAEKHKITNFDDIRIVFAFDN